MSKLIKGSQAYGLQQTNLQQAILSKLSSNKVSNWRFGGQANFDSNTETSSIQGIESDPKLLQIFRDNHLAAARRALAIAYPTVFGLVGKSYFDFLVAQYLFLHPIRNGDWGSWGETYDRFLRGHEVSSNLPYIADCARLDWAVHSCGRSQNSNINGVSFDLLKQHPPEQLNLRIAPGLSVINSKFPIVEIYLAHQSDSNAPDLSQAKAMLDAGEAQTALVYRSGWQSRVVAVKPGCRHWYCHAIQGSDLAKAVKQADSDTADFEQWLNMAIKESQVIAVHATTQ